MKDDHYRSDLLLQWSQLVFWGGGGVAIIYHSISNTDPVHKSCSISCCMFVYITAKLNFHWRSPAI